MLTRASIVLSLAFTCSAAMAQTATEAWRLGGFKTPESVLFDEANNRLIVSNIGAFGPEADGYLSIVSPDGKLVTEKWVSGLSDPKGLAIAGDSLFVADATGLVEIKLSDGSITATHALEGAQVPNDVATDGTAVFVSDTFGQSIYRVEGGKAEKWLSDAKLLAPNGLFVDGGQLYVGSLGADIKPDFSVTAPGGLQSVDIASMAITPLEGASGMSMSDGVAKLGSSIVFNDNPSGKIYAYVDGKVTEIGNAGPNTGDISVHGGMIYAPMMQTGEVVALKAE